MMDHADYWLAVDLARKALRDIPEDQRGAVMCEAATAFSGPDAIEHLSKVRASVSLRMQELIDEKFPLHETAEAYGDVPAVHARATAGRDERQPTGFFDLSAARQQASIRRQHRANSARQEVDAINRLTMSLDRFRRDLCFCLTDRVLGDAFDKGVCADDMGGQHDLK